jgi:molybdate transport system ATP-binding protein
VCVRPEDVHLSTGRDPGGSARNVLNGTVRSLRGDGPLRSIDVQGELRLRALVTPRAVEELGLHPGCPVVASFKAAAAHLLPSAAARSR